MAIVSGALNDAAAKKYDLEGWFPASQNYKELVSCSNCTDYQSRRLEIRYGQKKVSLVDFLCTRWMNATSYLIYCCLDCVRVQNKEQAKHYVHLLNSTLAATERSMCCVLENNQKENGIEIPTALRKYMGGKDFLPFQTKPLQTSRKGLSPAHLCSKLLQNCTRVKF